MGRPLKCTSEFRNEALELVRSSGRPMAEVARLSGMSSQTLGNWVKADRERRERDLARCPRLSVRSSLGYAERWRAQDGQGGSAEGCGVFCAGDGPVSRCRLVRDHQAEYPASRLCALAGLARSTFYAWRNRPPSARALANEALLVEIREIYRASRCTYGRVRIQSQLERRGIQVNSQAARTVDARAWDRRSRRARQDPADRR